MTKGKPLTVSCTSDSSVPNLNFTWTLNDAVLNRSHGLHSAVTLEVGEHHNGSILKCQAVYQQRGETKNLDEKAFLNVLCE